ncbi:MAG: NirD/YgiW/YdeI family stress tolerance protein [Myxococcota bacterium]
MKKLVVSAICVAALGTMIACDDDTDAEVVRNAPDGAWVRLEGTVVSAGDDSFLLDYGEDVITVEMDDSDWYEEGRGLIAEDEVIVHGRIDEDFYEARTIEASSVYVEDLGTHFYASAADEEELGTVTVFGVVPGQMTVSGTVKKVEGRDLVLDTEPGELRVDTASLAYNPLDDEGYQQIDVGDRVRVSGRIDSGLFDGRELSADWIVSLSTDGTKGRKGQKQEVSGEAQ